MADLQTIRIKHDGFPEGVVINVSDFIEGQHEEMPEPKEKPKAKAKAE